MPVTRRNTVIGLGVLAGGAGLITSTGAFDSVEADRDVTVEFADDSEAVLTMQPNPEFDGNDYIDVSEGADGEIVIRLVDVNRNAAVTFENLVQFTNNGSQPIERLEFTLGDVEGTGTLEVFGDLDDGDDGMPLSSGQSLTALGLVVDTREADLPADSSEIELGGTITISALAN
ncbi:MAG: hypothetical protein ACQETB_07335 [Halobacteriota archaeon]